MATLEHHSQSLQASVIMRGGTHDEHCFVVENGTISSCRREPRAQQYEGPLERRRPWGVWYKCVSLDDLRYPTFPTVPIIRRHLYILYELHC